MFRRITALISALALAGALSWAAVAAPITGSFAVDITYYPEHAGASKIDRIMVKFEADLILTMSISGLELTSTSLFTFKGVEVQIFSAKATVGALTFSTILVFAPSILEFEDVRAGSGSRGWCLRRSAPSVDLNPDSSCAAGFSAGINDPIIGFNRWFDLFLAGASPLANLVMGKWADNLNPNHPLAPGSLLTPALTFRKKVAETTISIAGLTLGVRGLFANFGTATVPLFETGIVLILAGTTVSGIAVRSETWIGARQGFECFGECKPLSRLGFTAATFAPLPASGGIVVGPPDRLSVQEEKLFITGISLAGVRTNLAFEFVFAGAGASSLQPTAMLIDSTARIAPLGITVRNIARFAPGLAFGRDIILFGVQFGEASATVQIDYRPTLIGGFSPLFTALIIGFDPPGASATIIVANCQPDAIFGGIVIGWPGVCYGPTGFAGLLSGFPGPFLEVTYILEFEVGDLSVEIAASTVGSLLKELVEAEVLATWTLGNVTITSWTIFSVQAADPLGDPTLAAERLSIEVKF